MSINLDTLNGCAFTYKQINDYPTGSFSISVKLDIGIDQLGGGHSLNEADVLDLLRAVRTFAEAHTPAGSPDSEVTSLHQSWTSYESDIDLDTP